MYLSGIAQQQGAARAMRDRRMSGGRLRQRGDNRPMLAAAGVTRCRARTKRSTLACKDVAVTRFSLQYLGNW